MTSKSCSTVNLATFRNLSKEARQVVVKSLISADEKPMALVSQIRQAVTAGGPAHDRNSFGLGEDWQDRVVERLRKQEEAHATEELAAHELVEKLQSQPAARRDTMVRNARRFHSWSVCRLLQKKSHAEVFRSPQDALNYALLAVEIAEGALLPPLSPTILNDLKASSRAYLGNAHRALSQIEQAEASFRKAWQYLDEGTGGPQWRRA